jgi:hypothetical protein
MHAWHKESFIFWTNCSGQEDEAGPSYGHDMHSACDVECSKPTDPSIVLSSRLIDAAASSDDGHVVPDRAIRRQAGERENARNKRRRSLAGGKRLVCKKAEFFHFYPFLW